MAHFSVSGDSIASHCIFVGMSLRVHPFLYEMSGAPCKFSFCAGFSSYDLENLRDSH